MAATHRRTARERIRQEPRRTRRGHRAGRGQSGGTRRPARRAAGAAARGDGAGRMLRHRCPPRRRDRVCMEVRLGSAPMAATRPDRRLAGPRRVGGGGRAAPASSPHTATLAAQYRLASVTKPLVARAAQVAIEEGVVDLDTPAGPPGSDRPAPAGPRLGAVDELRGGDGRARHAAGLLELRLRRCSPRRSSSSRASSSAAIWPRPCSSRSEWPPPGCRRGAAEAGYGGGVDGR